MKLEELTRALTRDKKTGVDIKDIRELKKRGYNVKTELIDGKTYFWIKDVTDNDSAVLISPRSDRIEKIRWIEISDIHGGSVYHDKKGFDWFLKTAWDMGYRHAHISGDLIDGTDVYPGQRNWLKYNRQEDQVQEVAETMNKYAYDWYACDGNHDMSFQKKGAPKTGVLFKAAVPKYTYLPGSIDRVVRGDIVVAGVMKRLAHPHTNGGRAVYALSYPSQTYLRKVFQNQRGFEIKNRKYDLQLLQYGHLHFDAQFTVYGVIVTHPLTFQKPNDYTEGMGLGNGRTGGRLTEITVQDGEILDFNSKVLFVPTKL